MKRSSEPTPPRRGWSSRSDCAGRQPRVRGRLDKEVVGAKTGSIAGIFLLATMVSSAAVAAPPDLFAPLAIYDGQWRVRASHPWSGAPVGAVDELASRCRSFTVYFACEQTINGKVASLIVYSVSSSAGRFYTRTIAPNGLAGGRGELILDGSHWTYLDKPPAGLAGDWSRTENFVVDRSHIRFEEYASSDEGKTWRLTNAGEETRGPS